MIRRCSRGTSRIVRLWFLRFFILVWLGEVMVTLNRELARVVGSVVQQGFRRLSGLVGLFIKGLSKPYWIITSFGVA